MRKVVTDKPDDASADLCVGWASSEMLTAGVRAVVKAHRDRDDCPPACEAMQKILRGSSEMVGLMAAATLLIQADPGKENIATVLRTLIGNTLLAYEAGLRDSSTRKVA